MTTTGKQKTDLATRMRRVGLVRAVDIDKFAARHQAFASQVERRINSMEIAGDVAGRLWARTMRAASVEVAARAAVRL